MLVVCSNARIIKPDIILSGIMMADQDGLKQELTFDKIVGEINKILLTKTAIT